MGRAKVVMGRPEDVESRKMFGNKKEKREWKGLWSERKTVVGKWKVESRSWACDYGLGEYRDSVAGSSFPFF